MTSQMFSIVTDTATNWAAPGSTRKRQEDYRWKKVQSIRYITRFVRAHFTSRRCDSRFCPLPRRQLACRYGRIKRHVFKSVPAVKMFDKHTRGCNTFVLQTDCYVVTRFFLFCFFLISVPVDTIDLFCFVFVSITIYFEIVIQSLENDCSFNAKVNQFRWES